MALKWNGRKVTARLQAAQRAGINATMSQAVIHAKQNHPWQNRTGTLEGSIRIVDFARAEGRGFVGRWGSADVVYALIQELGGTIRPVNAPRLVFQVDGEYRSASQVTIKPRPYLRPAADATYPNLVANIRRAFR